MPKWYVKRISGGKMRSERVASFQSSRNRMIATKSSVPISSGTVLSANMSMPRMLLMSSVARLISCPVEIRS